MIVIEFHSGSIPVARAALRSLRELPGWDAVLLRTKALSRRPVIPLAVRDRVHVRSGRTAAARAAVLAEATIVAPAPTGSTRLRLEAAAAGAALADPPGVLDQPELAAAAIARLAEDGDLRTRRGQEARASAEAQSFAAVAGVLDAIYGGLTDAAAPPPRFRNLWPAPGSSRPCTCTVLSHDDRSRWTSSRPRDAGVRCDRDTTTSLRLRS